jgi:hypothetical protein
VAAVDHEWQVALAPPDYAQGRGADAFQQRTGSEQNDENKEFLLFLNLTEWQDFALCSVRDRELLTVDGL